MANQKKERKTPIEVWIEDGEIAVRCDHGEWHIGDIDNRWLWVLSAVAFPEEHTIKITDNRKHRQDHQKDMTTGEGKK